MQVFHGIKELNQDIAASVVTIGNFDGVHLGHQELIKTVYREAQAEGVGGVVYTFHPHPVKVLHPERPTQRLFDLKDQKEQFEKMGMRFVVVEPFTVEFSKTPPDQFISNFIFEKLKPKCLVVGHDFSFGSDRQGNLSYLESFCRLKGIKLIIIPPFRLNGMVVSSTQIREALQTGDVAKAESYLGRDYYLRGHVEEGFRRGRTIGVPTANITPDVEFIPRRGVYCTFTKVQGHLYPSITNIGYNPTFSEEGKVSPLKIESHLLDFNAHLYGQEVEVVLKKFIRDERKFAGLEELKAQIHQDIATARAWFEQCGK